MKISGAEEMRHLNRVKDKTNGGLIFGFPASPNPREHPGEEVRKEIRQNRVINIPRVRYLVRLVRDVTLRVGGLHAGWLAPKDFCLVATLAVLPFGYSLPIALARHHKIHIYTVSIFSPHKDRMFRLFILISTNYELFSRVIRSFSSTRW